MRTWFVTALLLTVLSAPMINQPEVLDDSEHDVRYSTPLQVTISPSTGWTSGGQELTITGSGFSDLAFTNITDDGFNHQWVETTADYTDQAGAWNSIAVDSNGHIHVVHINGGNYQIRHSVYDGNNWNSTNINNCGHTYCWDVDMVIDDNDDLHVAYTTYNTNYESLVYMHYDGTSWSDTEVSVSANFGSIGIAVDSNNHPHISHAVSGQHCGDGLRLASYDGSSWNYQSIDVGSNRGCESDIVIDENDYVYISYQVRAQSKLKVATNKSGSWDLYTADAGASTTSLYPGYMTSMVMDQQGQFHIAHFDDKEEDLRYSTGVPNGQWTTTIVESAGHTGREPSIAVDVADNPHIVYRSWSGSSLKYATIDPATSNWQISTVSNNGDVGEGNSLFIDENGLMHVAFSDETNDVMMYATKSTGLTQTAEITVQFGQYGSVTGTVVDDTTITVMTPSSGLMPATVDITLWDKDGNSHVLSSSFQFISEDDLDSDGVLNVDDDCPNDAGNSTQDLVGCPDDDGDGYSNSGDAFPNDANETTDSDGDGLGDNADVFPSNGAEQYDSDGDGVGDNSDVFPNDANESTDTDGDGIGDNSDLFPFNANEWEDLDGNQIPDNSEASKIQISSSSQDLKIHPHHLFANNLTLTIESITSEGYTMVSIQSDPEITPNTGGLPYSFYGGDSQTIVLESSAIMSHLPQEFIDGEYISDFGPWINFTVHVTGLPHGCEGLEEWWDEEQQLICPDKVANYRTDFYQNFSMMLWNGDDDNDGVPNSWDFFPTDINENKDSDGDGVGDNADAFYLESTQWNDTDGDGFGDNWANETWNETRSSGLIGEFVEGAILADYCPETYGDSSVNGYAGCIDLDGNGVADLFEENQTIDDQVNENQTDNQTDNQANNTNATTDSDGDGVSDLLDNCPNTPSASQVDTNGCVIDEDDEDTSSEVSDSFFSGANDVVTTSVGIGAILLAIFTLLQTNAVAAILPDTFRWVQVLRRNSKLTKEEVNELTYLQSLVQAYYTNQRELVEELEQLKGDLTARFMNNEIKKQTREKLFVLIDELLASSPNDLYRIANNEAYFGLSGTIDSDDRSKLLDEKVAMNEFANPHAGSQNISPSASQQMQNSSAQAPPINMVGVDRGDGYELIEWPQASGFWWYRTANTHTQWQRWQQ